MARVTVLLFASCSATVTMPALPPAVIGVAGVAVKASLATTGCTVSVAEAAVPAVVCDDVGALVVLT